MNRPITGQQPIHLILDFDQTLTKSDTLLPLSRVGYSHSPESSNDKIHFLAANNTTTASDLQPPPPWSDIVNAYLSDLKAHTESYTPKPPQRTSLAQEAEWLASLRPIERRSFERAACEGRIWAAVDRQKMYDAAGESVLKGEVVCRDGWSQLVTRVIDAAAGGCVDVVSVNWSRMWIEGVLSHAWRSSGNREYTIPDTPSNVPLTVSANELSSIDEAPETTGIHTANDKLHCFIKLVDKHGNTLNRGRLPKDLSIEHTGTVEAQAKKIGNNASMVRPLTIYVGDSTSDLLCLIQADIGICMRDEPMGSGGKELAEVCARLGIIVKPLKEFVWQAYAMTDDTPCRERSWESDWKKELWWVHDFDEISEWVNKRESV